jgi:hypothetical protein
MVGYGLKCSGQRLVEGSCEYGNEFLGSVKFQEILE